MVGHIQPDDRDLQSGLNTQAISRFIKIYCLIRERFLPLAEFMVAVVSSL